LYEGEETTQITKRIALAIEYKAIKETAIGQAAASSTPQIHEVGGVIIIPIFFCKNTWITYPWGLSIPRTSDTSNLCRYQKRVFDKSIKSKLGAGIFPVLFTSVETCIDTFGLNGSIKRAFHDCAEEFNALSNLLVALSCSNISLEKRPAPAAVKFPKPLKTGFKALSPEANTDAGSRSFL
jgi:hypothetical protein